MAPNRTLGWTGGPPGVREAVLCRRVESGPQRSAGAFEVQGLAAQTGGGKGEETWRAGEGPPVTAGLPPSFLLRPAPGQRACWPSSGMGKLGVAPGPDGLALANLSCVPDHSGKQKKGKKKMWDQKKSQSLEEPLSGGPRNGIHPPLLRSKTDDLTFSKEAEKETGFSQPRNSMSNLMKHSVNFHRAFKDLPEEEELLDTFSCAWQREVPYHGRLYISHNHICFYCSMLRREVKVIIPAVTVSVLKKANTALLVPNAISIRTVEAEKFVFGSLRSRETTFQLLRSVCKHLQTSRQLDHNLVEDEMLLEESDGPSEPQKPTKTPAEQVLAVASRGRGHPKNPLKTWWSHLSPLNMVILIYLFLVVVLLLSSGYIGLRIVQLEEQLMLMGAWPEVDLQRQYKAS
ncbi:GRAM domain-containing protein 2B-like isoform X2 [Sphaerodactylus townsendi]|uniref:GRAM domain-containing protein 2B-like isoform X2 n=1 Tax=Sphaerodactylus townsendi TaxID=933632 RepID=UPI002026F5F0|nr:GRAM domain-containing protein 2B-like isoform X2 [Sphaerodactylus townsendi]